MNDREETFTVDWKKSKFEIDWDLIVGSNLTYRIEDAEGNLYASLHVEPMSGDFLKISILRRERVVVIPANEIDEEVKKLFNYIVEEFENA